MPNPTKGLLSTLLRWDGTYYFIWPSGMNGGADKSAVIADKAEIAQFARHTAMTASG